MLLLDTSFLIEFEDELVHKKLGPARCVLAARRRETVAISIITFGEFAEGFSDPRALVEFLAPFRIVILSRAIAWRTAALQSTLSRRLGENDAWIAATALSYEATLIARKRLSEYLDSTICRSRLSDLASGVVRHSNKLQRHPVALSDGSVLGAISGVCRSVVGTCLV
jgi:predicted nucleic acid-binding protein